MMPNTTYEPNNPMGNITQNNADAVSVANSETRKATKYKKYGIKDYNNLKNQLQTSKAGGLGANIGGEQWEIAKRRKEIANQYANNLKQMNAL